MTQDITIQHEHEGRHGRYFARLDDGSEAEMTYRDIEPGVISIDHTLVPDAFRGRGIAEKLVKTAIDDAERNNLQIIPVCSYVAVQFRRHPEWAHLKKQ